MSKNQSNGPLFPAWIHDAGAVFELRGATETSAVTLEEFAALSCYLMAARGITATPPDSAACRLLAASGENRREIPLSPVEYTTLRASLVERRARADGKRIALQRVGDAQDDLAVEAAEQFLNGDYRKTPPLVLATIGHFLSDLGTEPASECVANVAPFRKFIHRLYEERMKCGRWLTPGEVQELAQEFQDYFGEAAEGVRRFRAEYAGVIE